MKKTAALVCALLLVLLLPGCTLVQQVGNVASRQRNCRLRNVYRPLRTATKIPSAATCILRSAWKRSKAAINRSIST